jgi:hypothetical protein
MERPKAQSYHNTNSFNMHPPRVTRPPLFDSGRQERSISIISSTKRILFETPTSTIEPKESKLKQVTNAQRGHRLERSIKPCLIRILRTAFNSIKFHSFIEDMNEYILVERVTVEETINEKLSTLMKLINNIQLRKA